MWAVTGSREAALQRCSRHAASCAGCHLRQAAVLLGQAVDGVGEYGGHHAGLLLVVEVQRHHLQRQRLALLLAEAEDDHLARSCRVETQLYELCRLSPTLERVETSSYSS
jgi:hypothetical protein